MGPVRLVVLLLLLLLQWWLMVLLQLWGWGWPLMPCVWLRAGAAAGSD